MVESNRTITLSLSETFTFEDNNGNWGIGNLSHQPSSPEMMDTSIEYLSGLTTGEGGNYGKTLFPDHEGLQNSSSSNIEIYLHPSLSKVGAAEGFSHEGYGHALLYIRNGGDHNGASHQVTNMRDQNRVLANMILYHHVVKLF